MKAASSFTRHRREFTKLWLRYRLPLIAALFVGVVFGGGNFLWESFAESNQASTDAANERTMNAFREALGDPVAAQRKALAELSDDATLRTYLRAEADARKRHEAQLSAALNGALGVRLVPAGIRRVDPEGMPPLGYAALDLIRQSSANDRPQPAEVHMVGRPEEYLALVRKVTDGERIVGHVLAAFPAEILKQAVARAPLDQGYVELIQRAAGGVPKSFGQAGDASLKSGVGTTVPVNRTRFSAVFWMPPSTSAEIDVLGALLPVIGGVVVLLVGGLLVLVVTIRNKRRAAARVMLGGAAATVAPDEGPEGVLASVRVGARPDAASPDISFDEASAALPPDIPSSPSRAGIEVEEDVDLDLFDEEVPGADAPAPGTGATPPPPPVPAAPAETAPGRLDQAVFRAYDIRGIVGQGLDAEVIRLLGRAIGTEAYERGQQAIVVARDGRLSSDEFRDALVEGLVSTGRDVIDIGRVPTPVLYFSTYFLDTGSGVMVTGSHNAPEYNGLKIMLGGETLFGDAIQALRRRAESGDLRDGQGQVQQMDLLSDYVRRVTEDLPVALGNAYKIVLDCGNGIAGEVAPKLIQALGHDVVELYCDVDGRFPNHAPDPTQPENLADLVSAVQENGADLGFAFDGDGDRLGVVDAGGNIIWADRLMMLYSADILSRSPGASIVFDVKCTSRLRQVIEERGGVPIMDKTGHSYMKNKLLETDAELAGELSGHIFFKERWYGFDDGMYAAARLLEILMATRRPPADVFAELPTGVVTPEIQLQLEEGQPFEIMQAVQSGDTAMEGAQVFTVDGVRAEFADGWGLMRASNTSPTLIFRFEGDDEAALERIQAMFKARLQSVAPDVAVPF